jgi:hypothetical protein
MSSSRSWCLGPMTLVLYRWLGYVVSNQGVDGGRTLSMLYSLTSQELAEWIPHSLGHSCSTQLAVFGTGQDGELV